LKTSQNGIDLIKRFEGCRLTAYKPVAAEKYYTIGYGHYGPDVVKGMKITQAQADAFLNADLKKYENAVNSTKLVLNQNQFDALVSFTYNCGAGNLKKLVTNRSMSQIADALLCYNKGSGKVLAGLTWRRQAERSLFLTRMKTDACPYQEPAISVRYSSEGDAVRWMQWMLQNVAGYSSVKVDGIAEKNTISFLVQFQKNHDLESDGICGPLTRMEFKKLYEKKFKTG
jgi:GH24 family phage-related lysozyme (muramidase)